MKNAKYIILALFVATLLYSCSPAKGDFPGSEYMPDMAHSIAYEANYATPYNLHHWDSASVLPYRQITQPKLPVKGTVPRGYAGMFFAGGAQPVAGNISGIKVPMNGHVPFYYANTEEDRARAMAEITGNPFPITGAGLSKGKDLYTIYCAICHGDQGDGAGYLVSDSNPNAKYPAQPAILVSDTFVNASNGRFYYAIMYGRNLMGAYADKLNYEERWQVIHYIRSLQAQAKKLAYDENSNTLNPVFGIPGSRVQPVVVKTPSAAPPADSTGTGGERSTDTGTQQQGGSHSGGDHR